MREGDDGWAERGDPRDDAARRAARRPAPDNRTTALPRGTGGQRPVARSRPSDAQRQTDEIPRPARRPPPPPRSIPDPRARRAQPSDAARSAPRPPRQDSGYRREFDERRHPDHAAEYFADDDYRRERRGHHLPPYGGPELDAKSGQRQPRKLTVTRVAALRSRELTSKGVQLFRKATTADGADRSGLAHLTYAVMANYAADAALAVALANTLFFAAATAESTGKVLLYLLITVAPFAVIAPFIGPALDKIQNGRRVALAVSSFGRALLAIIMAFKFDSWVLYPCALGMMVLSKSFGVLKAALTPRVLPEQITLVKTNSRLTVFGLIAGGVAGAIAAGFAAVSGSSGALFWVAVCAIAGGVLCLRIPSWVESTEGEVPIQHSQVLQRPGKRPGFPPTVMATLWANCAARIETGFLALFIAFVVKTEYTEATGFQQLLLLGVVGAAAGVGGFLGNLLGAKLPLRHPEMVASLSVASVAIATIVAALIPGLATGAIVGLVGSTASSLAKVCLDSVLQHELPEASRASAFGLSESALQLAWVFGGVVGLLLGGVLHVRGDTVYAIGFGTVTVLLSLALVQSWLARSGRTMVPAALPALFRRKRGDQQRGDQQRGDKQTERMTAAPRTRRFTTDSAEEVGARTAVDQPPKKPSRRARKAGEGR